MVLRLYISMRFTCQNHSSYLAVFDISENRERRRLAKCLEAFGFRVQKSVFECRLSRGGLRRLQKQVDKLGLKTGTLLLYKVGSDFRPHTHGKPTEGLHRSGYAFVV